MRSNITALDPMRSHFNGGHHETKLLHEADGKRTFAVILQTGDEAMGCLKALAEKERVRGAQITAIGALSGARLAYFD